MTEEGGPRVPTVSFQVDLSPWSWSVTSEATGAGSGGVLQVAPASDQCYGTEASRVAESLALLVRCNSKTRSIILRIPLLNQAPEA